MRRYCVRAWVEATNVKIFEEVVEAESALVAIILCIDPEVIKGIEGLEDAEDVATAIKLLEDNGFTIEVFRV